MELIYKECTKSEFEDYYTLRCDENNIYWTGYNRAPNKKKLERWYSEQLDREDRNIFLIYSKNVNRNVVGYLYIDILGDKMDTTETGHGVHSNYAGKGIGTEIIKHAINYSKNQLKGIRKIIGWISTTNIGSIKNVTKNGYHATEETRKTVMESSQKEIVMRKYELEI